MTSHVDVVIEHLGNTLKELGALDGDLAEVAAIANSARGASDFVNGLRRKASLASFASRHIFADAFLASQPVSAVA